MIKQLKLKNQLYILVVVTLVMFFLFSIIYYVSFSTITYNRAQITAQQMMEQVAQNVENMTQGVKKSATGLSCDKYIQELLVSQDRIKNVELYDYACQLVNTTKASNSNIYSITWITNEHRKFSDPSRDDNGVVKKLDAIYDFKSGKLKKPFFSSVIQGNQESLYYFGYIFPIYTFASNYPRIGYGIFVLDTWELEKLVKINNITENSLFVILDQNNHVVVSNRKLKTGSVYENIFWEESQTGLIRDIVKYDGRRSMAQCLTMEDSGWKIVSIIPTSELLNGMEEVVRAGACVAILSTLILLLIGHIIIRNITEPINVIVDFLKRTDNYSLKERIDAPLQNEFAIIATGVNDMLESVESMTKKIVENQALLYESKLAEQNAELVALQSQINPHFLYNTLNCMSNIGLAHDIPEIAEVSVAMSNIYRYSIKGDKMVSLNDELSCIREYLKIMDIRFPGKFETEYLFEEKLLSLLTLRMILQPIVENAVYHGMEQRSGKGKLVIEGRISDADMLILTVQDNGKAMNTEQLKALRKSIIDYENIGLYTAEKRSIGLSNINKRIKLQFGNEYGLHIESEEGRGTRITLKLPVVYAK